MVWERDHKRREFLKLAAFSLAGLTTTGARGLGQAQREAIQQRDEPGDQYPQVFGLVHDG